MALSKIERLIAAAKIVEECETAIAKARGAQARAHNRPRSGVLVPRFDDAGLLAAWEQGWDVADDRLV